jgi:hypothetical protein
LNAEIVHYTPGRLRIKIAGARHQTAFFADLQRKLLAVEGILDVTINPTAASLVIVHDIGIDPRAVCCEIPGLAVPLSAPRPAADQSRGGEAEVILLLAKLLPLVFARHPVAQLAEVLGEPILRAVVDSMTRPKSCPLPAVENREEKELVPLAA